VVPPKLLEHGHVIRVVRLSNMRTVIPCLPLKDWGRPGFMGLGMPSYTTMSVSTAAPPG
jgi:2,4-diaminopentanoate dehydrogenase